MSWAESAESPLSAPPQSAPGPAHHRVPPPSLPGAGFSEGLSKKGGGIGWVGVGVYECDNASVLYMRLT